MAPQNSRVPRVLDEKEFAERDIELRQPKAPAELQHGTAKRPKEARLYRVPVNRSYRQKRPSQV